MSSASATGEAAVKVVRYRDSRGHRQEIRLPASEARKIDNVLRQYRRDTAKWEKRHETFTDRRMRPGAVEEASLPAHDLGNPWDGPRFKFPWLIGESRTWSGPESLVAFDVDEDGLCSNVRCAFCQGAELPGVAYCLACDRSGRDLAIPGPGEVSRIAAVREDDLKGGLEGKR